MNKVDHIFESINEFSSMIFERDLERRNSVGVWAWLLILYLIGLFFWGVFFDWRKSSLSFYDWSAISLPRYEIIRDAIQYKVFPLHADCDSCLHDLTDRFFVLPDVITTPQMLIMFFVDTDTFGIIDLILHYTLATVGLIALRNYLKLSLVSYAFLFFLFNFNGYIQSHYAVGHTSWAGYFLFPFFFLLIFWLFDHEPSWKWVAGMSTLSFYIILAGSQHHFTWLMLFLLFLALTNRKVSKWIIVTIIFSGCLSAIRLLPPVLGINEFHAFEFRFRSGYYTVFDFLSALTILRRVDYVVPEIYRYTILGYWELDYFIGVVGIVFIIYFGIVFWLRDKGLYKKYIPLLIPALLIFALSQGQIYKYTFFNFILFSSERVTTRMISVPVTFFIIMSALLFQEFLNLNKSKYIRWITISGLVILVQELYTHIFAWNIEKVGKSFGIQEVSFSGNSIVNHPDPIYITTLWIGLTLTLITVLALSFLVWRERQELYKV